ncbi:MAG TPA: sulfotransferase, partial [Vicinamibacteria bacterium]|nr:sulfotransferase [Vicinamibacteria bacterium]
RLDDRRLWWVGNPAFPCVGYLDQDAAARALGGPAIETLATFARRQVATFYETSAFEQGKATAGEAWFAEKQLPRPERQCLHSALFPDRREIYLVRDFRDMVASILSFNRKRGHLSFGRSPDDDDDRYMVKLAGAIEELMQAYRGAGEQGMLVRYEDLVRQPGAVLARILECLGLERSDARIQAMLRAAAETEPDAREAHRTSSDALSSIGRHRRDLSPQLIDRCDALFGSALAACGYTVPAGKA